VRGGIRSETLFSESGKKSFRWREKLFDKNMDDQARETRVRAGPGPGAAHAHAEAANTEVKKRGSKAWPRPPT